MKKIQISPSILSADFSQLGNEIKRLEEGGADMIHVALQGQIGARSMNNR